MMTHLGKILWADEEQSVFDTFLKYLEECFGDQIEVLPEIPLPKIEAMLERISTDSSLIALILDQRLKAKGTVGYTGIELADAVRRYNTKIPLYILTNWYEDPDLQSGDYLVEDIFDKKQMMNPEYRRKIAARVRRHTGTYLDILSDREKRFEELLRKSIESELSDDERTEFGHLSFWRDKSMLADEEPWAHELQQKLDEQQKLLEDLQEKTESQQGDD